MKRLEYRIRVPNRVAEALRILHPHLKRKVKGSLKLILANPKEGKELRDELSGLRSFRVSRFRIIYRVQRDVIEIVMIGPREKIYEDTLMVLKREAQK